MLYKLRRPSDGLFFSGSGYKKKTWTTNGRSYATEAMVRNAANTAIRQATGSWDSRVDPTDIEIVEYEIRENRTISV